MAQIKGGYYIKARKIQESEIAHSPPHFREIWDWLIKEANHKDIRIHGKTIKRGQCLRTYQDIRNGLSWKVGYRVERYTKWQCEKAMKFLRKATMVATTRTTRGIIITVLNYNEYQDPKNYEGHNEGHNESRKVPQGGSTINKNEKNEKNEKNKYPDWLDASLWNEFKEHRIKLKSPMTHKAEKLNINKLEKIMAEYNESQKEVITRSIERGWKGLFPDNKKEKASGYKRSNRPHPDDVWKDFQPGD